MKILSVLGVMLLVACAESERAPIVDRGGEPMECTDQDGDGYGEACTRGGDCNDADPTIHVGCVGCVYPAEGCACDNGSKPVSCYLQPSEDETGTMMCHEGTRYCRGGEWSACESVFSYARPPAAEQQAIVNPDAGHGKCTSCEPNCFVVRDNANSTGDGGIGGNGNNTQIGAEGGIRLDTFIPDASDWDSGPGWDAAACMLGSAPDEDCDGILDVYDPYPGEKPFATTNPTLFLDLAKGQTGTGVINLEFKVNSADVYFLVDQTTTMTGERQNLVDDLTTGSFVSDASYQCADYDFDHMPNNELKTKGLIGAIRCYIRDANFGVGYFRELPFSKYTGSGWSRVEVYDYGDSSEIAYRNLVDITNDVTKVSTGVNLLKIDGNNDLDETGIPALYSVVTGSGMYFGKDKMSVPQRVDCPPGTWGYPCFRNDAIPIVVMFTDAATHNGPLPLLPTDPNLERPYLDNPFPINEANTARTATLKAGSDAIADAIDLGDLTDSVVTVTADPSAFTSNFKAATGPFTCGGTDAEPDVFYKFNITSNKTVTMSTDGSEVDTTLAYWTRQPGTVSALGMITNNNETATGAPYMFNSINNKSLRITGDSSGFASDYLATDLGCSAQAGSSDAAFTFRLDSPAKVAIDTIGSTANTSVSLFRGTPPPLVAATVNDKNDTFATAEPIGPLGGTTVRNYSGTTDSATNINADYTNAVIGSGFSTSCQVADDAPDAVYSFSVSNSPTTKVRISTEGSTLDTVLALTTNVTGATTLPTIVAHAAQNQTTLPANLDGKAYRAISTTNSTSGNGISTLGTCNATSSAYDAAYKFTLSTEKTVTVDTTGTGFDTVVGIYNGSSSLNVNSVSVVAGSKAYTNNSGATAVGNLSSNANGQRILVNGSNATTVGLDTSYTATQVGGCNAADASPDAVYKFHLNSSTRVRLDTQGSGFDTVMSLHSGLPDQYIIPYAKGDSPGTAEPVSNRYLRFDSTTSGASANVGLLSGTCAANDTAPDHVIPFSVSVTAKYDIDTIGAAAGYNTVLGVYRNSVPPLANNGKLGEAKTSKGSTTGANDIGVIDNAWKVYTGSTGSMADNSDEGTSCNAGASANDVFYKFTVGGLVARQVEIKTQGSAFDTVTTLLGFESNAVPAGAGVLDVPPNGCHDGSLADGDTITATLLPGNYQVIVKGKGSGTTSGNYRISFRDATSSTAPALVNCDDDGGGGTKSKLSLDLTAGVTYYAVIKGKDATSSGTYGLSIKHIAWLDDVNNGVHRVTCNDNDDAGYLGTASVIDRTLDAGDYYVVIKGKSSGTGGSGTYQLNLTDMSAIPLGLVGCNNDAGSSTTSSLTETLPAGTYWAVVTGRGTPSSGNYSLTVRDSSTSVNRLLNCDDNSGAGGSSSLEADLAPGTYNVIVKGKAAGAKGAYKLQVREAAPVSRLQCDYNSGTGGKSSFETSTALSADTYTVIVKGVDAASATGGAYTLTLRDTATDNATSCNNTSSTKTATLSPSLTAGTYYVGLKGGSTAAGSHYQLHIGAGSTSSQGYYAPTYAQTLAKLNEKDVYVIPILSCHDDMSSQSTAIIADCPNARSQYTTLATETDTLNTKDEPLVFDIHADGTGLSSTVVEGIQQLAKYLAMDVKARVVFSPDANPGFITSVKAVKKDGDGCANMIDNEFKSCAPGAKPRFEISFTNPGVEKHPTDPKGGYNFRAELIGNDRVVDAVPIYIVPEVITRPPPPPQVYPSGTYWQDLSGDQCAGKTDLPDWNNLKWNANVPDGTSVTFGVCTGDSAAAVSSCTSPTPICKITGGGACTTTADCATGSICSDYGNCHHITGGTCTTNSECSAGATCMDNVCVYANQPIDVGAVLGGKNYASNLRVQIGLNANTTTNVGPVVRSWEITYLCKNAL